VLPERVADLACVHGGRDSLDPRCATDLERLGEEIGQKQYLDAALTKDGRKLIVFFLRAVHPRQRVEQQLVVVARSQSFQLVARTMKNDRSQSAHLGIDTEGDGARSVHE